MSFELPLSFRAKNFISISSSTFFSSKIFELKLKIFKIFIYEFKRMEFDTSIQNIFYLRNLPKDIQNEILLNMKSFDEQNKIDSVKQIYLDETNDKNYLELKKIFTKRSILLINLTKNYIKN